VNGVLSVFRREFRSYFATPVAIVFIVIFLMLAGVFTFYIGQFYEREQADLQSFFVYHPWLYLFLVPAISMRLWAEERKSGTLELILTLPLPLWAIVVGKFLAAWAFIGVALALTFPGWITVNFLGQPDNGVIVASYLGSFLMAGAYLAVGAAISATTKSQVVAFVVAVSICFLFLVAGLPIVLDFFESWAGTKVLETIAGFSFLSHFDSVRQGVIDVRDLVFFASFIGFWLFMNLIIVESKREAG
jgi:ABC-2 type transport system permease protein